MNHAKPFLSSPAWVCVAKSWSSGDCLEDVNVHAEEGAGVPSSGAIQFSAQRTCPIGEPETTDRALPAPVCSVTVGPHSTTVPGWQRRNFPGATPNSPQHRHGKTDPMPAVTFLSVYLVARPLSECRQAISSSILVRMEVRCDAKGSPFPRH